MAEAVDPDVVLLDLDLGDMDGCDVARDLRERAGQRRPLLIAMTGHVGAADRRRALAVMDLFLVKPCPPDFLLDVLGRFARVLAPAVGRVESPPGPLGRDPRLSLSPL